MIFRLSQKLSTKIKAGKLATLPVHANPLADWSAHLFVADRVQYILLSNTKSLYSTVMYGKGVTDDNRFITDALASIREFMTDDGQQTSYERFISPEAGLVHFARALDRTVTGSMNDLINHATACLADGETSPHDVGFQLNDVLLSALKRSAADGYGKPRDALKLLLDATNR